MLSDISHLKNICRPNQRLMGIDYGTKRIGVALSDTLRSMATPHTVLHRTRLRVDLEALFAIHDQMNVSGWVIGLPLNMDGTEGSRCQSTRQFVKNILELRDIPVILHDERLSSIAVERTMIVADLSRSKRAKCVDQAAAAFILQGVLDAFKRYPE
ncbi:MAG: Holliday junction resolvase RuvX [Alphaproteobacteria bacterium]|nr:MAG: Holliday junction resolvase RuvX [Alphaproteobacteria bacterium]